MATTTNNKSDETRVLTRDAKATKRAEATSGSTADDIESLADAARTTAEASGKLLKNIVKFNSSEHPDLVAGGLFEKRGRAEEQAERRELAEKGEHELEELEETATSIQQRAEALHKKTLSIGLSSGSTNQTSTNND